MTSPTKHNQGVPPARSRYLELAYQLPTRGSQEAYSERVAEVTRIIFDALDSQGRQLLTRLSPATDSMIHHTPNHLPQQYAQGLLVVSCPEWFITDAQTVQQLNADVIRACTKVFSDFGLSADAIQAGLSEASRQMATSSRA